MIRLFNHYLPLRTLVLTLIEALVLFQAMVLGFELRLLDRGGRSKGLVRPVLAQRFPALGFDRQRKAAATSFYQQRLAAEGGPLLKRLGGFSSLGDLGVVDPVAARTFAAETIAREPGQLHRVWDLLNLETWVRCS